MVRSWHDKSPSHIRILGVLELRHEKGFCACKKERTQKSIGFLDGAAHHVGCEIGIGFHEWCLLS